MTDRPSPGSQRAATVVGIVCAVLFAGIAAIVVWEPIVGADTAGILALRSLTSPALTTVMLAASFVAHGKLAIPLALLLAILIDRVAGHDDALLYAGACLSGEVLHLALKALVRHHRPVGISPKLTDAGWYSFPSGHAMLAVVIFGLGALLATRTAPRSVRVVAIAIATIVVVMVGISRVYLGAHWPSDVIGALVAGLGWSAACLAWEARRAASRAVAPSGATQRL